MRETMTKQEWLIMEALWRRDSLFLSELMDAIDAEVHWSHTTYLTYLKRMIQKGFVAYQTVRGSRRYSPAVSREDCVVNESRSLLKRMTKSSTTLFVSNMIREGRLSPKAHLVLWMLLIVRLLVPVSFDAGIHLIRVTAEPEATPSSSEPAPEASVSIVLLPAPMLAVSRTPSVGEPRL